MSTNQQGGTEKEQAANSTGELTYTVGAFADPLSKQLRNSGLSAKEIETFQADIDAITRLAVRGIATSAQAASMRQKFHKRLAAAYRAVRKATGKAGGA